MENKLKNLMKVGTFGRMKDGQNFVVVKDGIVSYQAGGFDYFKDVFKGKGHVYGGVDKLVDCESFNQLDTRIQINRDIIYDSDTEVTTFKVVCEEYKKDERLFTIGKIYTWNKGELACDDGFVFQTMVEGTDPEDWGLSNTYKFVKIVE